MTTILKIAVKPYTTKELAALLNMSRSTFNRAIKAFRKQLGKRIGHTWNVVQVEIIFGIFGRPYILIEE